MTKSKTIGQQRLIWIENMAVQVTGQDETPLHYSELRATRRNLPEDPS